MSVCIYVSKKVTAKFRSLNSSFCHMKAHQDKICFTVCIMQWFLVWTSYHFFFFLLAFGFRTEELDAYSVMVQGICWWRSMLLNLVRVVVMKVVLKSIGLCGESKNLKSSSLSKLMYKVNWHDFFFFFISIQSWIVQLHFTSPVYVNF